MPNNPDKPGVEHDIAIFNEFFCKLRFSATCAPYEQPRARVLKSKIHTELVRVIGVSLLIKGE